MLLLSRCYLYYCRNCAGKGNRRWYWLFLLMSTVFCFLYFVGAKYVQHYVTCADDASLQASWVRIALNSIEEVFFSLFLRV